MMKQNVMLFTMRLFVGLATSVAHAGTLLDEMQETTDASSPQTTQHTELSNTLFILDAFQV